MIEKSSTLYKIIILYMLEKVNFPLSNNQITNFFLDHGYTSYFHVQQTIHDLVESKLMEEKKTGYQYLLSDYGKRANHTVLL